jgi:hypothetical protein
MREGVVLSAPAGRPRGTGRTYSCWAAAASTTQRRSTRAALDRGRAGRARVPFGLRAQGDLRSSFITFLLSDANSDEALKKAVAHAMRHSTAQQGSAASDKGRAERTWAAAACRWRARSPRASSEARTLGPSRGGRGELGAQRVGRGVVVAEWVLGGGGGGGGVSCGSCGVRLSSLVLPLGGITKGTWYPGSPW